MHLSGALQRDLRALSDALDLPEGDLLGLVTELAASVRLAVESYLGMSLLIASTPDLALSVFDDAADPPRALTSLFLGLSPPGDVPAESTVLGVVLYARVPGAFVDLAADAQWLGATGAVRLDEHLPAPTDGAPNTYLEDLSTVNQALGVLVAGGSTLDEARARLDDHARADGATRVAAARRVLAGLDGPG